MSQKEPFNQELLFQANVAAGLAEALASVGVNAHQAQTQKSIEAAIATLLEPFQPVPTEGETDGKPFPGLTWAAGLIRQLPLNHDGRNSWLLNYGTDQDKEEINGRFAEQPAASAGTVPPSANGAEDLRNHPDWCEDCKEVHPGLSQQAKDIPLVGLLTLLSVLGGKRKPPAAE